jgi:hypothetical protein
MNGFDNDGFQIPPSRKRQRTEMESTTIDLSADKQTKLKGILGAFVSGEKAAVTFANDIIVLTGIEKPIDIDSLPKALEGTVHLLETKIAFGSTDAIIKLYTADSKKKIEIDRYRVTQVYLPFFSIPSTEETKTVLLSKGEDWTRYCQLAMYATGYLDGETPKNIQFQCTDVATTAVIPVLSDIPKTTRQIQIQIKGWSTCNLLQLVTFRNMFPFHVSKVMFDSTSVYVTMQTCMYPLRSVFQKNPMLLT